MKKNLLAVIILALVLVNLILTAVLVFSIIPQTKKSNELIDQVCAAINVKYFYYPFGHVLSLFRKPIFFIFLVSKGY